MNGFEPGKIINRFKDLQVLVVGEAMLDRYIKGYSRRISAEAPVPIVDVQEIRETAGGAANTAVNIASLGAGTHLLSVVGDDVEGKKIISLLNSFGVSTENVFIDKQRATLSKNRVFVSAQLLSRFDTGTTEALNPSLENKLINVILKAGGKFDALIAADYGYGLFSERVITALSWLKRRFSLLVVVDAKKPERFKKVEPTTVKPNYLETIKLLGIEIPETGNKRVEQITLFQNEILERTGAVFATVTLDRDGSLILSRENAPYRTYSSPRENVRAIGASDTYTGTLTLALAAGAEIKTAAELASAASGVVINKEGTAFCRRDELLKAVVSNTKIISGKARLKGIVTEIRRSGKRIVFTNGCFDILHSGHVTFLNRAKSLGDVLVVGVNSDKSIARLKGKERPINTLSDRLEVLAALSSVDHVIPFSAGVPLNLIRLIKPDIYTKGGDYTAKQLPEAKVVCHYGGQVQILPYTEDRSTTGIIRKIRQVPPAGLQTEEKYAQASL